MRKSTGFYLLIVFHLAVLIFLYLHSSHSQIAGQAAHQHRVGLVKELGLTDLCLFTEARYPRHPAMADLHAPFQDHPGAFEHFPSGSLVTPPIR